MKFRKEKKPDPSLNMTSLIDVVLLLLIFFMITMTFSRETQIALNLPRADGTEMETPLNLIEVSISAEGEFFVNSIAVKHQDLSSLKAAIEVMAKGDYDLPFIISGDARASHQLVMTALEAAGQLGFSKIQLASQGHME